MQLLQQRNISIYVISGGFRRLIEPVVESIGISSKNLYCNELEFNEKGEFPVMCKNLNDLFDMCLAHGLHIL